ncbi:serine hydrolase [Pseudoxanthomonas beigongshangi]
MKIVLAAYAALAAATPSPASAADPDFAPLARLIEQTKQATAHPSGTAVAVVKDGRVIYEGYFGDADIAAHTPVTRDTAFYIASATKPFFALNALLKDEAGQLDMRMSMREMFPDLRFAGFNPDAVTLGDLLVHGSGVDNPPLVWATAFSGVHDAASRRALVALSAPDPEAAHGVFKYTNVGYNIASVWMDERFGVPWQTQLDRAIFQPLGMHHTTARISRAEGAGWTVARPYSLAAEDPRVPLYLTKSDQTLQAAGGVVSTAPDLARFLLAQFPDARAGGLPAAAIMRSHQIRIGLDAKYQDFPRTGYAWGWYAGPYKGKPMLHHFGGFAGFHAHLSFMPAEGIGLVVVNNEDVLGAQLSNLVADHVYGLLLGEADVATTSARRFEELRAKAQAFRRNTLAKREEIRARTWHLSAPRDRYVGTYRHELLGDMRVTPEGPDGLRLRWGRLDAVATGAAEPDQLRVEFVPNSGQLLAFTVNDARVEALAFDGMVFRRRVDAGASPSAESAVPLR